MNETEDMEVCDERVLEQLEAQLPRMFTRKYLEQNTGGLFPYTTLSYFTKDPRWPKTHYMGKVTVIFRDEFINFLREYYGGMYAQREGKYRRIYKGTRPSPEAGEDGRRAESGAGGDV